VEHASIIFCGGAVAVLFGNIPVFHDMWHAADSYADQMRYFEHGSLWIVNGLHHVYWDVSWNVILATVSYHKA